MYLSGVFFQAEDGIRDLVRSRGLGDVYKRQVVFSLVGDASWPVLIATRVLGLPLVAGLAYEVLKLAKRRPDSKVVAVLTAPGLALQALTTRPPDDAQIEVAIAALVVVRPHLAQAESSVPER